MFDIEVFVKKQFPLDHRDKDARFFVYAFLKEFLLWHVLLKFYR